MSPNLLHFLIMAVVLGSALIPFKISAAEHLRENRAVVECVSKDVWDAGFILRFDLESCEPGPVQEMTSDLYEIVKMWTPERVFLGSLILVHLSNGAFKLVDQVDEPSVDINFDISSETPKVELLKLNGIAPTQFSELSCDPALITKLSSRCRSLP
jgi:hypothetical protein